MALNPLWRRHYPWGVMPSVVRRLWARKEVRYLLVAGTTQVVYLGTFALGLLAGWHYMLAIGVAQVLTIAAAFPAYRTIVFESAGRIGTDFIRFISVWAGGAVAGIVLTPALVELGGVHPFVAQLIAIVLVAVGSFLGHRYFSFRHQAPTDPIEPNSPSTTGSRTR